MAERRKDFNIQRGRAISGRIEREEKASERFEVRRKTERKMRVRLIFTVILFLVGAAAILWVVFGVFGFFDGQTAGKSKKSETSSYLPTVDIVDEGNGGISSRVKEFVGMVEADFADVGYKVERAVVPAKMMREVDVYLEGVPGYFKMSIERGSAEEVEDAVRMMKYLEGEGVSEWEYVDLRIEERAYYKVE